MKVFTYLYLILIASTIAQASSVELIGGAPAFDGEYPSVVYVSVDNARCSAAVVGERVLLLAAHCIGESKRVFFERFNKSYAGRCEVAPGYKKNDTADWALCKLSEPVEGGAYETINQDAGLVQLGDLILLMGYGCTTGGRGGAGGNDGTLRIGTAPVISIPAGEVFDVVTQGDRALCFGDSGGPAFKDLPGSRRVVIGVNSRGDIQTTSYLSSVSVRQAREFFKGWSERNGVEICGIHEGAVGCR